MKINAEFLGSHHLPISRRLASALLSKKIYELTPEDLVSTGKISTIEIASVIIESLQSEDYVDSIYRRSDDRYVAILKSSTNVKK